MRRTGSCSTRISLSWIVLSLFIHELNDSHHFLADQHVSLCPGISSLFQHSQSDKPWAMPNGRQISWFLAWNSDHTSINILHLTGASCVNSKSNNKHKRLPFTFPNEGGFAISMFHMSRIIISYWSMNGHSYPCVRFRALCRGKPLQP